MRPLNNVQDLISLFPCRSVDPSCVLLQAVNGTTATALSQWLALRWARGALWDDITTLYLLPFGALDNTHDAILRSPEALAQAISGYCFQSFRANRLTVHARIRVSLQHPATLVILAGLDQRLYDREIPYVGASGEHHLLMLSDD
ncbi:MAG: hypothetical protein AAGA62_17255 [Bacteroidota bacterium]